MEQITRLQNHEIGTWYLMNLKRLLSYTQLTESLATLGYSASSLSSPNGAPQWKKEIRDEDIRLEARILEGKFPYESKWLKMPKFANYKLSISIDETASQKLLGTIPKENPTYSEVISYFHTVGKKHGRQLIRELSDLFVLPVKKVTTTFEDREHEFSSSIAETFF